MNHIAKNEFSIKKIDFGEKEFIQLLANAYGLQIGSLSKNKQQATNMAYKSIEIFAGCGGMALGLEEAGFNNQLLVEVDKHCCATLTANRPDWNVVHDDITNVDFKKWRKQNISLVTGGFPCQAFSNAGMRKGFEDDRGDLFYQFLRCITEVKPVVFVGENVQGLVSHNNGKTLKHIINKLKEAGYIVGYKVLNAVDYGVPQKRKRLIILGLRKDMKQYQKYLSFPKPTTVDNHVTLKQALHKVPDSPGQEFSAAKAKVMKLVPPGECWVSLPKRIQREYMGASIDSGGGKTGMARRMAWDEASLTLTTSPSQKQTERAHPDENRPFRTREYARIQTFPDDWEFSGSTNSIYKQIGNAVPVLLAKQIGESVMRVLHRIKQNNPDADKEQKPPKKRSIISGHARKRSSSHKSKTSKCSD